MMRGRRRQGAREHVHEWDRAQRGVEVIGWGIWAAGARWRDLASVAKQTIAVGFGRGGKRKESAFRSCIWCEVASGRIIRCAAGLKRWARGEKRVRL